MSGSFSDRWDRVWDDRRKRYFPTPARQRDLRAARTFITTGLPSSDYPWVATQVEGGVIFTSPEHPAMFMDSDGEWDYVYASVPNQDAVRLSIDEHGETFEDFPESDEEPLDEPLP